MMPFGAPSEETTLVPVEPIDRQTALVAARSWAAWTSGQIAIVEAGRGDDSPLIQLLAQHRLAVQTQ